MATPRCPRLAMFCIDLMATSRTCVAYHASTPRASDVIATLRTCVVLSCIYS